MVVRFTLKAAAAAVHLTELSCVVVPVDSDTGDLDLEACNGLSAHDRQVITEIEGVTLPTTVFGATAGTATGTRGLAMTAATLGDTRGSAVMGMTGGNATAASMVTTQGGTRRKKSKKGKQRQSVVLSTTANHQSRMLASRMQVRWVVVRVARTRTNQPTNPSIHSLTYSTVSCTGRLSRQSSCVSRRTRRLR